MTDPSCPCVKEPPRKQEVLVPCHCPRDEHSIIVHEKSCLFFKNEKILHPHELETCECVSLTSEENVCKCCSCPVDQCQCAKARREVFEEWRRKRDIGPMPAVLESTHPLMKRFQETLKRFLEKENAIAEEEILKLRDELRLSKEAYNKDLETIYRDDHDTNDQRSLIQEYEANLIKSTAERQAAEKRAQDTNKKYRYVKEMLHKNEIEEREVTHELEALTALCRQLEEWREETESNLTISQRMSDKMRFEKKALSDEKRELDIIIFGLSNEVWKLESKLELFQKQLEIKNVEMEKVNDKVTAYAAELEDLELDKKRLVSLWNSVLVNIQQRDKVYDSVRDDYRVLRDNYCTLVNNLEITKKVAMEEMNRGKELTMNKDKILYDIAHATKCFETEDKKRTTLEVQINELFECIEMTERDEQLIKSENQAMRNILKSTEKELDRRSVQKRKLENDILFNIQEYLLNDNAIESMANGIKKMRDMSRKQELLLTGMENQHAKMMLDIEVGRDVQARNKILLDECQSKVQEKEKEIQRLEDKYQQKMLVITRKQRELDIVVKKFKALKDVFNLKTPQDRYIEELEQQIKELREKTENMQHDWLRLQGHTVKLTSQYHKLVTDINLINKQIQICEQKTMRIKAECSNINQERTQVERSLRALGGQLEVLERSRKDATEKNQNAYKANQAVTYEYSANLRDAEAEIIQLEEDIETCEKEKMNLAQELDRLQREALIWQRKGILAVDLKRNIQNSKSAAGEVGQMKNEIHRMEMRREQLRKTCDKLSEDLALYVTRRETAMEKSRAAAAVEKVHGSTHTSQFNYHHKLRLARTNLARVTKDLADASSHMEQLEQAQQRLKREVADTISLNAQLEERIATLLGEHGDTERQKQWMLERVVRSQRLGNELLTAVKRSSISVKKPKSVVLSEYEDARKYNDTLKGVISMLFEEYPYINDRLEIITNTLNIHSPTNSPRLTEKCDCLTFVFPIQLKDNENIAEKPEE